MNDLTPKDAGENLSPVRVKDADARYRRSHLTDDEWQLMLDSLTDVRHGMTPDTRRLLYLTALGTGFRRNELSCLHRDWIHDGHIHLPAARTKNRTTVKQPISTDLHALLTQQSGQIFPDLKHGRHFMRQDIEAAGLPYVDSEGGRRDLHSIRGRFITKLLEAQIPIHIVQRLARHASPQTTLSFYARVNGPSTLSDAINKAMPSR